MNNPGYMIFRRIPTQQKMGVSKVLKRGCLVMRQKQLRDVVCPLYSN